MYTSYIGRNWLEIVYENWSITYYTDIEFQINFAVSLKARTRAPLNIHQNFSHKIIFPQLIINTVHYVL